MKLLGIAASATILFAACNALAQTDEPTPTWITATNKPCEIWNPDPQPNESVTWSGGCVNGFASGKGVLRWTEDGQLDVEFDGTYANGKRNGPGVMITPDGDRTEGVWANDNLVTGNGDTI